MSSKRRLINLVSLPFLLSSISKSLLIKIIIIIIIIIAIIIMIIMIISAVSVFNVCPLLIAQT